REGKSQQSAAHASRGRRWARGCDLSSGPSESTLMTPTPKPPRFTWRSLRPLASQSFSRWSDINAPRLGAALAFYAVLSIAPLLVLCVGIAGMAFERDAVTGQIVYQFQSLIGYEGGKIIQALVLDAAKPAQGIVAGAVGVLMLLFG